MLSGLTRPRPRVGQAPLRGAPPDTHSLPPGRLNRPRRGRPRGRRSGAQSASAGACPASTRLSRRAQPAAGDQPQDDRGDGEDRADLVGPSLRPNATTSAGTRASTIAGLRWYRFQRLSPSSLMPHSRAATRPEGRPLLPPGPRRPAGHPARRSDLGGCTPAPKTCQARQCSLGGRHTHPTATGRPDREAASAVRGAHPCSVRASEPGAGPARTTRTS